MSDNFFSRTLEVVDPEITKYLEKELVRQQNEIQLIASENIVSPAVMAALGTVPTNKYAEGYIGKRYYGGCEYVDKMEMLAIERAKQLFKASYVNVQPHSGSQANQAVFFALLEPGDVILGMALSDGGHLTHGAKPNFSGKWFRAEHYTVDQSTGLIDYKQVENLAIKHKPKIIIAGSSAYPRRIDFKKFRKIADKVGAYLFADIAHYAGLIVSGLYPSPMEYADVVTTTTHKTLRGPRGGMILSNNEQLFKKLDSAVFPGIQGGPLMNIIASKAVAFKEALMPQFKTYGKQVLANAHALSEALIEKGYKVVSGGTDSHIVLLDLSEAGLTGKEAEAYLGEANITCNKNTVPGETRSPFITSGIRLGSPACTTRGFTVEDFTLVGHTIAYVIDGMRSGNKGVLVEARQKVKELCTKYPIYT